MSSIAQSDSNLPADEELVAYLDGELGPDDCRRVEARLESDPAYQQKLRDLDRAWEALEVLPITRAEDDFARTTMGIVTVAAEHDMTQHARRYDRVARRRLWRFAALAASAAVIGFLVARFFVSRSDSAIVTDLPVIQNVDLLTQIQNLEFLRRVHASVPANLLADNQSLLNAELSKLVWASAEKRRSRWKLVDSFTNEEKATLASRWKRFNELPPDERRRIRDLHQEILSAKEKDQLQQTLVAYGQWLSQLTPGEQEQLREELWALPADQQPEHLSRWIRRQSDRASRTLSAEDTDKLRAAVLALVDERRSQLLSEMRGGDNSERARRLQGPRGALTILSRELQNEETASAARKRLIQQLSPEAQDHLRQLGGWNGRMPRFQLWQWIRDSLQPRWGAGELENFFATELDNVQRERLLNLPPGEMQAELERLYLANEFGVRGMGELGIGPRDPMRPSRPDFRPGPDDRDSPNRPPPPPLDGPR
jgi:hypothetical protein